MPISYIHASVSTLGTGARGVISDVGNRDCAPRRNVDQRAWKETREKERDREIAIRASYSPVMRSVKKKKNLRNNIIIYRTIPSRSRSEYGNAGGA